MTLYAHTQDGAIGQIGALPTLWLGPTRWHDWRGDPETWSTQPADFGWLPVVESPRPADTATHTHEPTYTRDGATVVQTWTPRPWTAGELTTQAEQAAYEAQRAVDRAILDATAALMADAHTEVSRGPSPRAPMTPTRSALPSLTQARRGRTSPPPMFGHPGYPVGANRSRSAIPLGCSRLEATTPTGSATA